MLHETLEQLVLGILTAWCLNLLSTYYSLIAKDYNWQIINMSVMPFCHLPAACTYQTCAIHLLIMHFILISCRTHTLSSTYISYYSSDFVRQESNVLASAHPATALCVCVSCIFARRLVYNHYAIAHAHNAANAQAQGIDWACWSQKFTFSLKALRV